MFSEQHSFFRGKTSWLLVQKSSCLSRPPKVWCVGRALSRWDLKKTMALPKDQLENHLHHVEIYGSLFLTLDHIDGFWLFIGRPVLSKIWIVWIPTNCSFVKWRWTNLEAQRLQLCEDQLENLHYVEISLWIT